jgi:hypothetical protein
MPELEAIRTARLQRTLAAVAVAHPFYRQRFGAAGIAVHDIRSLDELAALPLTPKSDSGDVLTCMAWVTATREFDSGGGMVDCEFSAVNQTGEVIIRGDATAALGR